MRRYKNRETYYIYPCSIGEQDCYALGTVDLRSGIDTRSR